MNSLRMFHSRRSIRPAGISRSDKSFIAKVRGQATRLRPQSSEELVRRFSKMREQTAAGKDDRDTILAAFALLNEALRRTSGREFFEVQLAAGRSLCHGTIVEMQTGEGKTITTGLAAVAFALHRRGVHIATTNDYLAQRDAEEMQAAYQLLGLTTGLLPNQHSASHEKHAAYECDITYGTGYEFGFDFLRDQLQLRAVGSAKRGIRTRRLLRGQPLPKPQTVQSGHAFLLVDEADSVLIDEATTPLIISQPAVEEKCDEAVFRLAHSLADSLQNKEHFQHDPASKHLSLTLVGWQTIHAALSANTARSLQRPWAEYVTHALRAKHQLRRDVDYLVRDNQILIIDQNTGRIHEERTWQAGLHQAVQTREGVEITPELQAAARISRQRYFRMYERMSGLTGTTTGLESEFAHFYQLPVCRIPTHKPSQRKTERPQFFADEDTRDFAIARDVQNRMSGGQPVLVGTRSVFQSRRLSDCFARHEIEHVVLNGTQSQDEAEIVSRAGQPAVVTVATSLAGRGTDIRLHEKSKTAGGLHVIVAGHHDARRIDRQLIGRCARQGDPGSCQFFISAEDDFLARNAPDLADQMRRSADAFGLCRHDFSAALLEQQRQVEHAAFVRRHQLVDHDAWLDGVLNSLARRA